MIKNFASYVAESAARIFLYPKRFIQKAFRQTDPSSLKRFMRRGSIGSFGYRLIYFFLSFVGAALLARFLGTSGFGAYSLAIAWVGMLNIPAGLGLDKLLVREIAIYQKQASWSLMNGLLRWANQTALFACIGLALVAAIVSWFLIGHSNPQLLLTFWVSLILLPLTTIRNLRLAAMRGLHHVLLGQLPEMLIQPLLLIVLVGGAYFLLGKDLNSLWAMAFTIVSYWVSFVIGVQLLLKKLPQPVKESSPQYQPKIWMASALPLMFIGAMQVINGRTDALMLGALKGVEAVGVYSVVDRLSGFTLFFQGAINMPLAPLASSLYAAGDMKRLESIISKASLGVLLATLPLVAFLILGGHWCLSLFGPGFTQGQSALTILSLGQLVNAATGAVAVLLTMSGHEKFTAISIGASAIVNVVLNALLIPPWGVVGAATATSTSIVLMNILMAVWVYKKMGIHSTVLGRLKLRRKA